MLFIDLLTIIAPSNMPNVAAFFAGFGLERRVYAFVIQLRFFVTKAGASIFIAVGIDMDLDRSSPHKYNCLSFKNKPLMWKYIIQ